MAVPRNHTAGGAIGGRFYVVGGRGSPKASTAHKACIDDQHLVEVYDPATDRWQSLPPMPDPRHGIFAGVIGSTIYLPGGGVRQGLGATNVNSAFRVSP